MTEILADMQDAFIQEVTELWFDLNCSNYRKMNLTMWKIELGVTS